MNFVRFPASIYSEKEKNQRINSSYMRHAAFFSLLCLLFLPGFSQEVQEGYKKINQFIVPVDLLDPARILGTDAAGEDPARQERAYDLDRMQRIAVIMRPDVIQAILACVRGKAPPEGEAG